MSSQKIDTANGMATIVTNLDSTKNSQVIRTKEEALQQQKERLEDLKGLSLSEETLTQKTSLEAEIASLTKVKESLTKELKERKGKIKHTKQELDKHVKHIKELEAESKTLNENKKLYEAKKKKYNDMDLALNDSIVSLKYSTDKSAVINQVKYANDKRELNTNIVINDQELSNTIKRIEENTTALSKAKNSKVNYNSVIVNHRSHLEKTSNKLERIENSLADKNDELNKLTKNENKLAQIGFNQELRIESQRTSEIEQQLQRHRDRVNALKSRQMHHKKEPSSQVETPAVIPAVIPPSITAVTTTVIPPAIPAVIPPATPKQQTTESKNTLSKVKKFIKKLFKSSNKPIENKLNEPSVDDGKKVPANINNVTTNNGDASKILPVQSNEGVVCSNFPTGKVSSIKKPINSLDILSSNSKKDLESITIDISKTDDFPYKKNTIILVGGAASKFKELIKDLINPADRYTKAQEIAREGKFPGETFEYNQDGQKDSLRKFLLTIKSMQLAKELDNKNSKSNDKNKVETNEVKKNYRDEKIVLNSNFASHFRELANNKSLSADDLQEKLCAKVSEYLEKRNEKSKNLGVTLDLTKTTQSRSKNGPTLNNA